MPPGKHGNHYRTHMMSKSPEYTAYHAMLQRCYNPKCRYYHNYGGRGIKVCARWRKSFENFYEDMGPRPKNKRGLDRFPNNKTGNYRPGNCRWATQKQQMRNIRDNVVISYKGISLCLIEWAEKLKMSKVTLWMRLFRLKWPVKKAFETPINQTARSRRNGRKIVYRGQQFTIATLSRLTGMNSFRLSARLRLGWDVESAVSVPIVYGQKHKRKKG